jgi:hypothetical protein
MLLGVFLQQLATGPLDGKKVQASIGLSDFNCAYDVRMLYPAAVLCFADKTGYGGTIVPQLFAKNF